MLKGLTKVSEGNLANECEKFVANEKKNIVTWGTTEERTVVKRVNLLELTQCQKCYNREREHDLTLKSTGKI